MNRRTNIILVAVVLAVGAGGEWERRALQSEREEVDRLRRVANLSRQQWQKIQTELTELQRPDSPPMGTAADAVGLKSGDEALDARLRTQLQKVYELKRWIESTPGENLPEFRFANDSHWFEVVGQNDRPLTPRDMPRLAHQVKERAQFNFLSIIESALRAYVRISGGPQPKSLAELVPLSVCPIDDALVARYEIVTSESGKIEIQEILEDPNQATRYVSSNGLRARIAAASARVPANENRAAAEMGELSEALLNYRREHNGATPKDSESLRPYVKNPAVLDRYRPRIEK